MKRAFGLVSVLIAVAVLVIGVESFISSYYGALISTDRLSDKVCMVNLSRRVLDQVMDDGYIPPPYDVTLNGVTYHIVVTTSVPVWVDDGGCSVSEYMWCIKVHIERKDKPTRFVDIYTLRRK